MLTNSNIKVAMGATGGVVLIRFSDGEIALWKCVGAIGAWANRDDYFNACKKAIAKF